jgi:hypothetical protein
MTPAAPKPDAWQRLNLIALLLALAVLTATGLAWWRDRMRTFPAPRWDASRFVALAAGSPHKSGERWIVAVSLACPHCQEHLRALASRIESRPRPPALAALLVDQPERPAAFDLGVPLTGGAWWDSARVWREEWGRRAYGETFRFGAHGELLSATPAGVVPDSAAVKL